MTSILLQKLISLPSEQTSIMEMVTCHRQLQNGSSSLSQTLSRAMEMSSLFILGNSKYCGLPLTLTSFPKSVAIVFTSPLQCAMNLPPCSRVSLLSQLRLSPEILFTLRFHRILVSPLDLPQTLYLQKQSDITTH